MTVSGTTVSWGTSYYVDSQQYSGGSSGYNTLCIARSNKNHAYLLTGGNYSSQPNYIMGKELFVDGKTPSNAMSIKYSNTTSLYSNISTNGGSYWRDGIIDSNSGNFIIGCQYDNSTLYVLVVPGYFALTSTVGTNAFGMSLNETEVAAGEMVTVRSFANNLPIKDYLMFR